MRASHKRPESNLETLKDLSEGLLRSAGRTGERGNLLEIHHRSAPLFDPVFLHTESEALGVAVSLTQSERVVFMISTASRMLSSGERTTAVRMQPASTRARLKLTRSR